MVLKRISFFLFVLIRCLGAESFLCSMELEICEEEPPIHSLPAEVLCEVFSYVPKKELASVGSVCKDWQDVVIGDLSRVHPTVKMNPRVFRNRREVSLRTLNQLVKYPFLKAFPVLDIRAPKDVPFSKEISSTENQEDFQGFRSALQYPIYGIIVDAWEMEPDSLRFDLLVEILRAQKKTLKEVKMIDHKRAYYMVDPRTREGRFHSLLNNLPEGLESFSFLGSGENEANFARKLPEKINRLKSLKSLSLEDLSGVLREKESPYPKFEYHINWIFPRISKEILGNLSQLTLTYVPASFDGTIFSELKGLKRLSLSLGNYGGSILSQEPPLKEQNYDVLKKVFKKLSPGLLSLSLFGWSPHEDYNSYDDKNFQPMRRLTHLENLFLGKIGPSKLDQLFTFLISKNPLRLAPFWRTLKVFKIYGLRSFSSLRTDGLKDVLDKIETVEIPGYEREESPSQEKEDRVVDIQKRKKPSGKKRKVPVSKKKKPSQED